MHHLDSDHPRARLLLSLLIAGLGATSFGIWQWRSASVPPQALADGPVNNLSGDVLLSAYRSSTCGCCKGWLEHLKAAGFRVADNVVEDLVAIKRTHRVPVDLSSCHTATVAGYVIEGHVPASAIRSLLRQRPAVAGLAVPGMPLGSPGMESALRGEAYTVFSFTGDGDVRSFQQFGA